MPDIDFQRIELNLIPKKGDDPVVFYASQYETARPFIADLKWGNTEFAPGDDCRAEIDIRKNDDNLVVITDDVTIDNNEVSVILPVQAVTCIGKNLGQVKIYAADDQLIAALNFILEVQADPLAGGVTSETAIDNLTQQIEEITTEVIGDDYYNKTEVDDLLDDKADISDLPDMTQYYTKSQTDTLLNGKANTSDLATVAMTGDYDDLTNKPTIPAAQVQSDYAQVDNTKVDYIKNKPDLSIYAKETDLILATGTENEAPYQIRQAPPNIGNLALEKLVGVSCVFNQLVQNGNFESTTGWSTWGDFSLSVNNNILTATVTEALTDRWNYIGKLITGIVGHKYFVTADIKSKYANSGVGVTNTNTASNTFISVAETWTKCATFVEITSTSNMLQINVGENYQSYQVGDTIEIKNVNVIDLTAMFGSEVADYLYTLESGTAGAGVSLFKSLFADEYYPYTANTLMSAKPTSKVIKDSNNQTVATIVYSGNELRGLLKVGNNGLYADGDIDDGSGSTTVRYEQRAYQSGDESLTDAITDGTNTVVKLAIPTMAVSTAWSNPIIAKEGGTEEFTDSRTIKMPCGHDTIYSKGTDYRYW